MMRAIDPTFSELNSVKEELRKFINEQYLDFSEQNRNFMASILKKVILMKYIVRQKSDDYRLQALLSDLIYLIRCIKNGEERYYYLNIRSLIEQSLRIVNDVASTDTMTNYNIMSKSEDCVSNSSFNVNLDIIKNQYSKSCLYVHGNSNANMQLAEIYFDSIKDKEIDNLNQKLNELVKLLKELFRLIFISNSILIDAAFHRRKSILRYLTDNYSMQIIVGA